MAVLIISIAFGLGLAARRAGLPPLVGFLVAGFALRPLGVESDDTIRFIADLGITLLMFTIGLKLKLQTLARPVVWAGGSLHTVLTTVGFAIAILGAASLGVPVLTGLEGRTVLLIAFALSFSSTVFAVKILEETGDLSANFGKVAIGVLIMQDLFAVLFLVFSAGAVPTVWALALLLLLPARPILHRISTASGHGELLVVCGLFLAIVAGYAAFDATGVKGDLGALLIGVLVGSHPKSKEMADALFGLKELLLVGFFVNVGLSGELSWSIAGIAALLLLLLPVKMVLYFILFTRFGLRARGATLATLSLANFSEFGLIVAGIGVQLGWLDASWLVTIALALAASLVVASPLGTHGYTIYEKLAPRLRPFENAAARARLPSIDVNEVDALIFGMGRVGVGAYRVLEEQLGSAVLGLDHDVDKVSRHRAEGRNVVVGDGIDHELWEDLHTRLDGLPLVVLALPDHTSNLQVMRLLNQHEYRGVVAAVATFSDQVAQLRNAGANTVHNFYAEAGAGLARDALEALRVPRTSDGPAPTESDPDRDSV